MMYDFFMYTGASETLPNHQNYKMFSDNWFSTLLLLIKLKEKGFLATPIIRADRLKG